MLLVLHHRRGSHNPSSRPLIPWNRWHSRIQSISQEANVVVLERPLPFNVSTAWNPKVYSFMTGISEVGIQDLTIEMK